MDLFVVQRYHVCEYRQSEGTSSGYKWLGLDVVMLRMKGGGGNYRYIASEFPLDQLFIYLGRLCSVVSVK